VVAILGKSLARVAGVAAAVLPKRYWGALDMYVPVTDSASIAGILTILTAGAIGVPGFITYAAYQVSSNNVTILRGAVSPSNIHAQDWGQMILGGSGLSIFTFILLTPAGWVSTYLGISGTWRAIAAAVDDPLGDPILTGLDLFALRSWRWTRVRARQYRRRSMEGPVVGDRVIRGPQMGIEGAELVIISSRRKPLWDVGTAVDTGERWFRLSAIEERRIGGYLRTLYLLNEHQDFEAFRRRVRYELPVHFTHRNTDTVR
jgi:hypothetical protein